jgi:undecaprenyl-diphosphatase
MYPRAHERDLRTRFALRVLVVGVAGFAAVAASVQAKQGQAIDEAIAKRVQAVSDPRFERAMIAVSWLGFRPQSRVLPALYAGILWLARYRREAVFQLAAWGTAPLSTIIKEFMRRPRPVAGRDLRVIAQPLGGSSFPSGHVMTYVSVYGWMAIMAHQLVGPGGLRRLVVAALVALVGAIGPSRIYLGHHWPSDVAGSYLLGSSYLAALVLAYRRLLPRRALR